MTAGALTYVLVLITFNFGIAVVPGYDSLASCEAVVKIVRQRGLRDAYCIPGPVEAAR